MDLDTAEATAWFDKGAKLGDPDCAYGLAQLLVPTDATAAIRHFETAAKKDHVFSAYNLGIAHLFGHGDLAPSPQLAARWHRPGVGRREAASRRYGAAFLRRSSRRVSDRRTDIDTCRFNHSGLPEGLFLAALYHQTTGDQSKAKHIFDHAARLGFGMPWRDAARQKTGTGGAGGVSLFSNWPDKCRN